MNEHTFLIRKTFPGESRVCTHYLESVESTTTAETWATHSRNALRVNTVEEAAPIARKLRERSFCETLSIVREGA